MSADTEMIEEYIKENYIKYYEYEEFNKIEETDSGCVGKVYKANQKGKFVALKSFKLDNSIVKEIIHEVSNQKNGLFG
jgi:hypothetical protein